MATMNYVVTLVLIITPVFAGSPCVNTKTVNVPQSVIDGLFQRVQDGQIRSNVLTKDTGNYENVQIVHHINDRPRSSQKWQLFKNMHLGNIPLFVTNVLMEAYLYSSVPKPSDDQLLSTLEYCYRLGGDNKPYNHSLIWAVGCTFEEERQICIPSYSGYLEIKKLSESSADQSFKNHRIKNESVMGKVMNKLNKRVNLQNRSNLKLFQELFYNLEITPIVPDSDATFLWLGLGSTIEILRNEFPLVRDTWINYNSNISSAFDALKKYAYRPFSSDPLVNTLDSGNYYYLRHFLDDAKTAGKDVTLPSVWFTNAGEKPDADLGNILHKMTLQIDLITTADVVHGFTNLILSGLVSPDILKDKDLNQIYNNASSMIVYLINSNFSNRPDLALFYYPSRYMFYWSVARTVSAMDSYKQKQDLPVEDMDIVFKELKQTMEGETTRFLISNVKHDDDGSFYFDDFLGNGDLTEDNKPITRGEDRIFTTAMAVNTLMYTWLSFDSKSGQSSWKTYTPNDVKDIVDGCVMWLVKNSLEGKFKPWNSILILDSKGADSHGFRYPSNTFIEIPQLYALYFVVSLKLMTGVQGYIPKNEYEALIKRTQFGKPIPTVFKGYDHPDFGDKIFWSSDPLTYAATMLALSRYRDIIFPIQNDCIPT